MLILFFKKDKKNRALSHFLLVQICITRGRVHMPPIAINKEVSFLFSGSSPLPLNVIPPTLRCLLVPCKFVSLKIHSHEKVQERDRNSFGRNVFCSIIVSDFSKVVF